MTLGTAMFQNPQESRIDVIAALAAWPLQELQGRVWLRFSGAVHVRKNVTKTHRYLIRKTSTPMRNHVVVAGEASFSN
jgi:hypothetical protein